MTFLHKLAIGKNYRQIIKVNKLEFCDAIKNLNKFAWFKSILDVADKTVPGLIPKNCPVTGVRKFLIST